MNARTMTKVARTVWHYTDNDALRAIQESGELRAIAQRGENPLVWFSMVQGWRPGKTRLFSDASGVLTPVSFEDADRVFGHVRLGLPASDRRLLNWDKASAIAGTPRKTRLGVESGAKADGVYPKFQWFATPRSIPLPELQIEVWESGCWCALPLTQELAVE